MPFARPLLAIRSSIALLAATSSAIAQCPTWMRGFAPPGVDDQVSAMAVFDDGSGSALYVGGIFHHTAGGPAENLARWDGTAWSHVQGGVHHSPPSTSSVDALAVFDDGTGPALYVGGMFDGAGGVPARGVAKWDGSSWSALGTGFSGTVRALTVFDDGTGPALYAGGGIFLPGSQWGVHIVRWDGNTWSAVGGGVSNHPMLPVGVYSLAVFDDGTGDALYVAGSFGAAGGTLKSNIAKWDGTAWSALGSGTDWAVNALAVYDNGSGSQLYAGGEFGTAGGTSANRIAAWNGSTWSAVGSGIDDADGAVKCLAVIDDGTGAALHVGGRFTTAGGIEAHAIAKWNGASWATLGGGLEDFESPSWPITSVNALAALDFGDGVEVYAGGNFDAAGGTPATNVATYRREEWRSLGSGAGVSETIQGFAVFDDGTGEALYAGGRFLVAGDARVNRIAKWDGSRWSALGSGLSWPDVSGIDHAKVLAMTSFDDGSGPALYVGGWFTRAGGVPARHLARWDGSDWSTVGGVTSPWFATVSALTVFDDGTGPALYVGGGFTSAGGIAANCIAKWDGSAWSALGSGLDSGVYALTVFDDGTGPALYAGGEFTHAGRGAASRIAKWNGAVWSPLEKGVYGGSFWPSVTSLAVYDDGTGPALVAGGNFGFAGDAAANSVAKWDGSRWSALGADGPWWETYVTALSVFDDGFGQKLYAGGYIEWIGGVHVNGLARWDGSSWLPLASELVARTVPFPGSPQPVFVHALASFDDGNGRALYVGGNFVGAGDEPSYHLAAWRGCVGNGAGTPACFGDGGAAACPCGNVGTTGRGCENSSSTGGAWLTGSGGASLSADTLVLTSSAELPSSLSIFAQGITTASTPTTFGDGLLCIEGSFERLYVKIASGGSASAPGGGEPPVSERSASLGAPITAGTTRTYQVLYRDADAAFCPRPLGGSFNTSQALRIRWGS